MFDYKEQQVSGEDPKSDQSSAEAKSASCGGGEPLPWESRSCGCGAPESSTSTDLGFSNGSQPTQTETVFAEQNHASSSEPVTAPLAAHIDAAEKTELWEELVQSQEPSATDGAVPVTVARNPMQWTLVDLTAGMCDKPGCDPLTCDSEDCEMEDEYDRAEYDRAGYEMPGYTPAVAVTPAASFDAEDAPEYAFQDSPAPAPVAFEPAPELAPRAETESAKKPAAAKKTKKAEAPKKAAAKGKKAAKKPAAKKTVKKAASKKATKAKKPATRSKKGGAKTSLPLPTSDPNFPRVQAA